MWFRPSINPPGGLIEVEDEQEQRRERAYQSGAGCPGTGGWTTPQSSSRRRGGSDSGPQAQVQGTGREEVATGWRGRVYISPSVSWPDWICLVGRRQ